MAQQPKRQPSSVVIMYVPLDTSEKYAVDALSSADTLDDLQNKWSLGCCLCEGWNRLPPHRQMCVYNYEK
jgi:hypothetical protein